MRKGTHGTMIMKSNMRRNGLIVFAGGLLCIPGCGVDLGTCDTSKLGPDSSMPNTGQVAVQARCASGRCHSETASGKLRMGAPAGLSFDVVPADTSDAEIAKVERGVQKVQADSHEMWGQIEDGNMPPEGQGSLSASDKESVRNWLACGAPIINAPIGTTRADWESIYTALAPMCLGCHSTQTGPSTGQGFVLGDRNPCSAYHNVVGKASVTPMCSGTQQSLVVPSDPNTSLLLRKLEATQSCGMPMPLGSKGLGPDNATVKSLRTWIENGALAPAGCM
jgi:hypothetical protein